MNTIIDYRFNAYGKEYDFRLNTREVDRDYDDEDYCYWIEESDEHYFEINIFKDDDGNLTKDGCVFAAIDLAAFEDMDYSQIDDVTIEYPIQETKAKYEKFVEENGQEPMFAECRIIFKDSDYDELAIIKLSEDYIERDDSDIFYYCRGLSDILSLMDDGVEDFIIKSAEFINY